MTHVMSAVHCPFCGSETEIETTTFGDSITDFFRVKCKQNGHSLDWWEEDKNKAIAIWNERQQPVREKTLDECKEFHAKICNFSLWYDLKQYHIKHNNWSGFENELNEVAELYASSKSVETQQGWIKTSENPPENKQHVLGWRVVGLEGWLVPMVWNIHTDTENEFPHYMINPEPPTETNN